MSLERAQANCKRCYTLADEITRDLKDGVPSENYKKEIIKTTIYGDDKIANARNDAMKALESVLATCLESHRKTGVDLSKTYNSLTTKALEACAECDFKEPKISNLVKDK